MRVSKRKWCFELVKIIYNLFHPQFPIRRDYAKNHSSWWITVPESLYDFLRDHQDEYHQLCRKLEQATRSAINMEQYVAVDIYAPNTFWGWLTAVGVARRLRPVLEEFMAKYGLT